MVRADTVSTVRRVVGWGLSAALLVLFSGAAGAAKGESDHMAQLLQRLGAHRDIAERGAAHVALGMPKFASDKTNQAYLLVRNGYVISYSGKRNAMNWASWKLTAKDMGEQPRDNSFRPDPTLPKKFAVVADEDYWIPGYVRGHMVRSGERSCKKRENSKTYVFTNILPQAHNNNSGPWNAFENYYRDRVKTDGLEAYVMAGGVFGKKHPDQGKVAVPTHTWKVVAFLKPGQTASDITAETRVIGVLMPNNNRDVKVEYPWAQYRVPVSTIEKQTGLKFFRRVKPAVAKLLRDKLDTVEIGDAPSPGYEVKNWEPRGAIERGRTGTVKWIGEKNGYTFAFVKPDKGDKDVYIPGYLLKKGSFATGDRVTFNAFETERGFKASKMTAGVDAAKPAKVAKTAKPTLKKEAKVGIKVAAEPKARRARGGITKKVAAKLPVVAAAE